MRKLGALIIVGLFLVAAFPMVCIVVSGKETEMNMDSPQIPEKRPNKPPVSDEPSDKTHLAVVIGIAKYRGGVLQYTDDDARDMYAYLLTQGYQQSSIKLLIDRGATYSKIMAAIDWLDQYETESSEIVFFYSGHGAQVSSTREADGYSECLVSQEGYALYDYTLQTEFSSITSQKFAIIFDSCFSGGMIAQLAGSGRVIVTACSETQLSYDGESWMQNGVFTYYFMNELVNYDTIEEAYSESKDDVANWGLNYGISFNPQMDDQFTDMEIHGTTFWDFDY